MTVVRDGAGGAAELSGTAIIPEKALRSLFAFLGLRALTCIRILGHAVSMCETDAGMRILVRTGRPLELVNDHLPFA